MLTVAEGVVLGACVIDAHPAMRRNVIPTKVELMKLVFIGFYVSIGFYRVGVDNKFLTNASEGDSRGDLRTVCCSEIYRALDEGAIQIELICKAVFHKVVLQIAPADLRREPSADLKFETALHLVAPIRAVHRFSHDRPPLAVDFERRTGIGVKSTYIAFRVKRYGFPDLHFPAGPDHGIDPIGRRRKAQLVADSQ